MIVWVVSSESVVNIVYLALLSNNEIVTIVSEEVTSITANVNCVGPTDLSLFGTDHHAKKIKSFWRSREWYWVVKRTFREHTRGKNRQSAFFIENVRVTFESERNITTCEVEFQARVVSLLNSLLSQMSWHFESGSHHLFAFSTVRLHLWGYSRFPKKADTFHSPEAIDFKLGLSSPSND